MAQLYELSFVYQNKKQTVKILPQNFQMIIFWAAVSKFCPLSHSQSQIPIVNLENREFKPMSFECSFLFPNSANLIYEALFTGLHSLASTWC